MPNTREKLIELLRNANRAFSLDRFNCDHFGFVADNLIANGVTVQEWKPVTEPPKKKGCYFVAMKHWLDGKPVTREAYWNSEDWLSCERRHEITPRVTHWMPLPEPLKGE